MNQGTPPAAGSACCTDVAGRWAWRVCDVKGCVSDQCVMEVPQICVDTGVRKVEI